MKFDNPVHAKICNMRHAAIPVFLTRERNSIVSGMFCLVSILRNTSEFRRNFWWNLIINIGDYICTSQLRRKMVIV